MAAAVNTLIIPSVEEKQLGVDLNNKVQMSPVSGAKNHRSACPMWYFADSGTFCCRLMGRKSVSEDDLH